MRLIKTANPRYANEKYFEKKYLAQLARIKNTNLDQPTNLFPPAT